MSLLGFQQALAALVMSPQWCAALRTTPQQAFAGYELSATDQARLLAIAHDPGVVAGTMIHRSFRLSMLAKTLPHTCTVLGPQGLQEIVHAYWRVQPPNGYYYKEEADRFGAFALARVEQGQLHYPFLEEVLHLELAMLALAGTLHEPVIEDARWRLDNPDACFPTLHPLCRLVLFRHDPETLLTALYQGHTPEQIAEGTYYVLLDQSSSKPLQIKQVDVELGAFLSACDGRRSLAQLGVQWRYGIEDVATLAESGCLILMGEAVSCNGQVVKHRGEAGVVHHPKRSIFC